MSYQEKNIYNKPENMIKGALLFASIAATAAAAKISFRHIINPLEWAEKKKNDSNKYDIITVGAGTAGCAEVAIIHFNTNKRILLIEQGRNQQNDPNIRNPANIAVAPGTPQNPTNTLGGLVGENNKYYLSTLTRPI